MVGKPEFTGSLFGGQVERNSLVQKDKRRKRGTERPGICGAGKKTHFLTCTIGRLEGTFAAMRNSSTLRKRGEGRRLIEISRKQVRFSLATEEPPNSRKKCR